MMQKLKKKKKIACAAGAGNGVGKVIGEMVEQAKQTLV